MRKLVIGCAVAGLIAMSPKSEARLSASIGSLPSAISQAGRGGESRECEYGLASWYGKEHRGNTTASGELFDLKGLTAAHRNLRMGTTVKVTNLANHRIILLRVNDRGPGNSRRLIDISWAAAKQLGFLKAGLARVQVEVVTYPKWANPKQVAAAN